MINVDFFTPEIGTDILMNVLEDWIGFLIKASSVLHNFYVKQERGCQPGALLKMPRSSRSMEKFVSEMNKFKISYNFSLQK